MKIVTHDRGSFRFKVRQAAVTQRRHRAADLTALGLWTADAIHRLASLLSPRMNVRRLKHPRKDLERVLREAETQPVPWRVTRGNGYFIMWCGCPAKHKKTVRLTPSDPNYERNLRGWLRRSTCWKDER